MPVEIELNQQNSLQDVIVHLQTIFGIVCQLYTADLQPLDPSYIPYQLGIAQVYATVVPEGDQQQIQLTIVQDMVNVLHQITVPLGTNLQQITGQFQGQYQSIQLMDPNQQPVSNDEDFILQDPNGYILSLNSQPLQPVQQFPAQNPINPPQQPKGNQAVEQEAIQRLELFKIISNICITADPNGKFVVYKYHSMKSFIQGILYEHKGIPSKKFASNTNFLKLGPISFLENGDGIVIKWADGKHSSIRVEQKG
ncbi:hypothetical protein pb186bvf_008374 [Paramecium bursaria]